MTIRLAAFIACVSLVLMLIQKIPVPTAILRAAIVLGLAFAILKIVEVLIYIIKGKTGEHQLENEANIPDEKLDEDLPQDEPMESENTPMEDLLEDKP